MKNVYLVIAASLISFAAYSDSTPTLKIDIRCGILARPSKVDVVSLYIDNDNLGNYDGGYTPPSSRIHLGGFDLQVIGNKLSLVSLQDGSKIDVGIVEVAQDIKCSYENLETFNINQSSNLDVSIETSPSICNSRQIDGQIEHYWIATRTFKISDRVTNQQATFSIPIRPNDDPAACQN